MKKMNFWGVGPLLLIFTLLFSAGIIGITHYFGKELFVIPFIPPFVLKLTGLLLILSGITLYVKSVLSVSRAFLHEELYTRGAYAYCRHPVYSSWILFIVPGIALAKNSWALLVIPVFMYILFRILIKTEETYLEAKFGFEFRRYKRKTTLLFPKFWKKPYEY